MIDTLVSVGANQVNGPGFEMDNPDAALDEARSALLADIQKTGQIYAR